MQPNRFSTVAPCPACNVIAATLCLAVFFAAPAAARPSNCAMQPGGESAVVEVVDAQTLRLADGRFVRLAGLFIPQAAGGDFSFDAAARVADLLRSLTLGRRAHLRYGGRAQDRYGVHLAQVEIADGPDGGDRIWLQERLAAEGLALAASQPDNRACARDLQRAEHQGREARRGFWQSAVFRVIPARDMAALRRAAGTYQIVEGRVARAERRGSRIVLLFSEGERAFSAEAAQAPAKALAAEGVELEAMAGRLLRVRGWVVVKRLPLLEITHPEQVETLGPHTARAAAPSR
jgi:endonuclease YncB( thermonuclease family)